LGLSENQLSAACCNFTKMKINNAWLLWLVLLSLLVTGQSKSSVAGSDSFCARFLTYSAGQWQESFYDSMASSWENNWFLDGELASLTPGEHGLDFWAGPNAGDDASHAVLWTHQEFFGDIMIEFDYTRLDSVYRYVNIIYVQAQGSGQEGYDPDIYLWREQRKIPAMRNYFLNMHTYHISYAAYGVQNDDPKLDYVRARRYTPALAGLRGTDLTPDYFETGLFLPGVRYQVAIIKKEKELMMRVRSDENESCFYWTNDQLDAVEGGRIGLRHMYTRGSRYSRFRVSTSSVSE
jgi:hypothetical protein